MPAMLTPVDHNNPSYPTKTNGEGSNRGPPAMPSLTSAAASTVNANMAAADAVSTGNLTFQSSSASVLSQPLTTVASVCSSMVSLVTSVSTGTPGARAPVNIAGQPISSGALNTGPTSAVSSTNMLHGSMTVPGSSSLLSTALSSDPTTKNSIMVASSQPETQTQNALLKQLLSSTPTPKSSSDTSPVKTSFSLEAQLDQPTDNIEKDEKYNTTKPTLSSLASQIPNPQGQANQAASPTPGQTKVTQSVGQASTVMAPPSMLQGPSAPAVSNPGSYIAQQNSSGANPSITSPPPMATSTPTKAETSPASMSEGLAPPSPVHHPWQPQPQLK